jgi:hypothetical protein
LASRRALLGGDGHDAGDITAHDAHPRSVLQLPARLLKAQVEFPSWLERLVVELISVMTRMSERRLAVFMAKRVLFRDARMKRVLIGSFAAASAERPRAIGSGTPSTSNRYTGATRTTQNSGAPLPCPCTSIGFFDTGTSGNTRIQTRPRASCAGSARGGPPRSGARGDALRLHRLEPELAEMSANLPFALP